MDRGPFELDGSGRGEESNDERGVSRRRFLGSVAAGAGALAVGSGSVTGARERERCQADATIRVGGGTGQVINNAWGTNGVGRNVEMCIFRNEDGSYGWEWERGETSAGPEEPNYPEVLIGNKPWSKHTNQPLFPVQRGDVQDLTMEIDVDMEISGGEWNLALEWWLTPSEPPGDPTHETMVVLQKSDEHVKDDMIRAEAVTDRYGTTYDHWVEIDHVDWEHFHVFKTTDNEVPEAVDVAAIQTYLDDNAEGRFPDSHWMTGIEVGNENWDHTQGRTTVNDLDVRLNGQTATTGTDSEFTEPTVDTTPPPRPSGLAVEAVTPTSVIVSWAAASDEGSGVAEYEVSVGSHERTASAGTTTATVEGLAASTEYQVRVVVVDGAGNRSQAATRTVRTPAEEPTIGPVTGDEVPQDPNSDGHFEDVTGDGTLNFNDLVAYYQHKDDPVMTDHTDAFDYNDDGELDFNDLVALYQKL